MLLSIVIRTKNSEATIAKCLESIKSQFFTSIQIIIVDNNSSDQTLSIVKEVTPSVKVVRYPKDSPFNYSKAINIGAEVAQSKYLMVLSSHVALTHPASLDWMMSFLEKNELIKVVSLYRDIVVNENRIQEFEDIEWEVLNKRNFKGRGMSNYCSMIRRSDWLQRKFNEEIPACEDQEWINHFMQHQNAMSVTIYNPKVYYSNPYYNLRKDFQDHVVISRVVHPYLGSYRYILKKLFIPAIKLFLRLRFSDAKYLIHLGAKLLFEKVRPTDLSKFSTPYNKKLS